MRILMTKFVKKSEITSSWFEIDAKNAVVGRLATVISKIIRGKNKNTFTPHMDHGDFVVVKNVENIKFTGKKFENKIVTLVWEFDKFYPAEDYHQDYYEENFMNYLLYKKACGREQTLKNIWKN